MPNRTRKRKAVPTKPDLPPPVSTIKPGTDFYKHINGNWLRHASMPPYLSSYGVSEEIEDIIDRELMSILTLCRKQVENRPASRLPHSINLIGTLAESALNTKTQKNNIRFLNKLVNNLRCIRDTKDIATTLGDLLKHRIPSILSILVVPKQNDAGVLRFTFGTGELGLPDPSYYVADTTTKTRTITAYSNLLKRLAKDFDVSGLERIVALEVEAAEAIFRARRDEEELFKGRELEKKFPDIPWLDLIKSMTDWSDQAILNHSYLITSRTWLSFVNTCFKNYTLDSWKLLFSAQILLYTLPLLPPPYDNLEFELFGHRLRGQSEKTPQHRLALKMTKEWLSSSLGYLYIKENVPKSVKKSATQLAKEIRAVAAERAGSTEWLEPSTRAKAARKVRAMYLGVAYPSYIYKDESTALDPENFVKNVYDLGVLDFHDELEKVDTRLHPEKWDDAVFAVNAYYYNEKNRLILPSGILRWPFFDSNASDGWNFGGLGATIGHEICHAFDDDGKDYDETGNKHPWWSKEESERYLEKTSAIVTLYNKTTYFGHHLSGELTLSENIADLGGLAIALSALKKRLDAKKVSATQRRAELCDFFTSYAVSWRTKERKEKALQALFMDLHAPPVARVNNIVAQFDDWYEVFDIKPGDPLYIDPRQRIRIF